MIAIIDYQGGNLASVLRALEYLGHKAVVTSDPAAIREADRVILPGVGAARATMRNLAKGGLDVLLREEIYPEGKPFLGICIGVQIIFEHSEEEDTPCLGLVRGTVRKFRTDAEAAGERLKVPQIGWNQVTFRKPHPIFAGVDDKASFYFVNSFYPVPESDEAVYATTNYGVEFASVIGQRNLVATQFHLEKSGPAGLRMLDNFCRWDGRI